MSYIYQRLIKENNTNNPELHKKATHRLRCHATRSKKAMFQRRCTHIVKIQKHKISNRSRVMTTSGREKCCKEGPAGGSVEGEVSGRRWVQRVSHSPCFSVHCKPSMSQTESLGGAWSFGGSCACLSVSFCIEKHTLSFV